MISSLVLLAPVTTNAEIDRDSEVAALTPAIYAESHALLIGVSNYTEGWARLDSVPAEIAKVDALLRERGFQVHVVIDPNYQKLRNAFEDFVARYGYAEKNRLLFFFSGHGHTRQDKGYLVPADAPVPSETS